LYTSHVYGGNDAWPLNEIGDQIAEVRESSAATSEPPGHVHFRLSALFADSDRLAQTLAPEYRDRAIVPAFPWLGARAPAAPVVVVDSGTSGPERYRIATGDSVAVRWWLIQARGRDGAWTTTLRPAGDGRLTPGAFGTDDPDEVAVTAIGVTGVASPPSITLP